MWACSRKVEAVLLAAFALFLSQAMPNMDRNTNRNNNSTHYKAIIQFWRLSLANQGTCKCNIDKNTCKPSNLCLFFFSDEASMVVFQPRPTIKVLLLTIVSIRKLISAYTYMYMYMYM